MSITVCLSARTIGYPQAGGHLWVYLNWALGLRLLGCKVIWLESMSPDTPIGKMQANVNSLKNHLDRYGLSEQVALCSSSARPLPRTISRQCLDLATASKADLLLNLRYETRGDVVARFARSALLDIDPGLLQLWIHLGKISIPRHDIYFTIGETVPQTSVSAQGSGIQWQYTPPCVALEWWPTKTAANGAPFTTVSHWTMGEWMIDGDEVYSNDKRTGFLPFLELPRLTSQPLELALCLAPEEGAELSMLRNLGWQIRHAWETTATPWDYQDYIQTSRGEFSCAKPSCIRLQNAWISDRTLCYLASGKPAVVQHTGPSRFLPDAAGLFRFHTLSDARQALDAVAADYENQCLKARALAEEYFDAKKVVKNVLARALPGDHRQ